MRAVASRSSATMCVGAAGMMIQGVQSCSARTAGLVARKAPGVVSTPPSFSPQRGTGPGRLRPGPVFAGIGGRVGDLAFIDYMDTGRRGRCFEKQLRVCARGALS